jgi:hypothetical protein
MSPVVVGSVREGSVWTNAVSWPSGERSERASGAAAWQTEMAEAAGASRVGADAEERGGVDAVSEGVGVGMGAGVGAGRETGGSRGAGAREHAARSRAAAAARVRWGRDRMKGGTLCVRGSVPRGRDYVS